jgi:phosphoglucosamine mutase
MSGTSESPNGTGDSTDDPSPESTEGPGKSVSESVEDSSELFGTSGVRGPVGDEVTCELALSIGRALASEGHETVVVGRDARESGRALADAAAAGLRECGADVVRLGQAATPTVARSVGWLDADAGLMVTASHNPPADNGLKLWKPSGQAFGERQREAVARRVREDDFDLAPWDDLGTQTEWDGATDRHAEALARSAAPSELSVVVDAGNGVGGVTAEALRRLGHDVRSLNATPDGSFPARPSEPTAENCRGLREFVAATDADLGIAHDGDADRMRAVTADGTFLSGDVLLAVLAADAAAPGDTVAVPVDTSLAVADHLAAADVGVERTPVGDVYVAAAASRPGVAFGGEPSGAWIWPTETLCPDGPLAACKLAALAAREPLAERAASIETYPIRRENVRTDEKDAVVAGVRAAVAGAESEGPPGEHGDRRDGSGGVPADAEVDSLDGVRVGLDDGWFLIRASGTQPLVRLTAEARSPDRAHELLHRARALVERASDGG